MLFRNIRKWIFLLISILLINPVFFQTVAAEPRISQAVFSTSVKNRKPINQLDILSNDLNKLYFFTDIRGYQGHTLTHQWTYNDWVVQSLPFTIKGHRWRVSSSKTLDKKMKGKWTVKVLDDDGTILQENSIAYSGISSQVIPENKPETKTSSAAVTDKTEETSQSHKKAKADDKKESTLKTLEVKEQNKKPDNDAEMKEQTEESSDTDKTKETSKGTDDGDEEDCDSDNSDQSASSKDEAEAFLTDEDFEPKANTKKNDAVAKMAEKVIEQLENIPANSAAKPE